MQRVCSHHMALRGRRALRIAGRVAGRQMCTWRRRPATAGCRARTPRCSSRPWRAWCPGRMRTARTCTRCAPCRMPRVERSAPAATCSVPTSHPATPQVKHIPGGVPAGSAQQELVLRQCRMSNLFPCKPAVPQGKLRTGVVRGGQRRASRRQVREFEPSEGGITEDEMPWERPRACCRLM